MVLYGSWAWTEENTFPPWASIVKAPFWHLRYYTDLRTVLLHPIADPAVTLDSALNLVTVCTGTVVLLQQPKIIPRRLVNLERWIL